jgi:TPP-dependent pyruvate/acetoin dehydrogenase alpha subunit
VSIVSIGDGALSQGAAHEALNFAAVFALPLVVVVENNRYSEMTPIAAMVRINPLARRADGYGIPSATVDGNDVDAVQAAVREAVERARQGEGPTLVEALTERLVGHYSGDLQQYRPSGEVAAASEREPLARLRSSAGARGATVVGRLVEIDQEVSRVIEQALADARSYPLPSPSTARDHLYA